MLEECHMLKEMRSYEEKDEDKSIFRSIVSRQDDFIKLLVAVLFWHSKCRKRLVSIFRST